MHAVRIGLRVFIHPISALVIFAGIPNVRAFAPCTSARKRPEPVTR
jgi:hypothetical protein